MSNSRKSPGPDLPRRSFASEPVHLRLAEICRKAILDGDYPSGEKFPSERELAERFDVSRATANKVLSTLIAEGLLELKKGIGTWVKKRRTLFASLIGMESFTAHAREQGLEPSTEVLAFETRTASDLPEEAKAGLGVDEKSDETFLYLERLRLADGAPMILEARWVRESLASGLRRSDVEESFYRVLEEKFGLSMTGEEHSISAVLLDESAVKLFRVEAPFPALRVEGTGFVSGETPLWYQRLLYRGDRYQLHNRTLGPGASKVELQLHDQHVSA